MTKFHAIAEIERGGQEVANQLFPRQATVVGLDGANVKVRFVGEASTAPPASLPTTVSGVPVGTIGWVMTAGGGKGVFVATAVSVPIPFTSMVAENRFSTSEIANAVPIPLTVPSIEVPPGTYKVDATAMVSASRTATDGQIVTYLRIGGVKGPDSTRVVDVTTPGINAQTAEFRDVVTTTGTVTLVLGGRGGVTAGTTRFYKGMLVGTLTRIG